jgi:hypothetical protein
MVGAAAGLLIAAGVSAGAFGFDAISGGNPIGPTVAPPTLIAGTIGSALVAGRGWRARSRRDWVFAIALLALSAVAIGDVAEIGVLLSSQVLVPNVGTGAESVAELLAGVVEIFALGLVFVGWFAVILTTVAATLWAAIIALVQARVDPERTWIR